ncbi:DUF4114 domain-containing protein [Nostoc sp. CHAB 5824]|nr:DUF4114 domain-containing protein [Nostoc sp. CHAB 5824]
MIVQSFLDEELSGMTPNGNKPACELSCSKDLPSGGDNDFNDVIVRVNLSIA